MATKSSKSTNKKMSMLVKSHIDLPEKVRTQMVELLNQQLADMTDLYSIQTENYDKENPGDY